MGGKSAAKAMVVMVTTMLCLLAGGAAQGKFENVWSVSSVADLRQALENVSKLAGEDDDQAWQFQVVVEVRPGWRSGLCLSKAGIVVRSWRERERERERE